MEKKMSAVEEKLIQVNMKSSEGNLVFPNQLNEELDTFSHVIEADAAPTQPQLDVFKVISGRLDEQLTAWAQIKTDEVVKINRFIKQADRLRSPWRLHPRPLQHHRPRRRQR